MIKIKLNPYKRNILRLFTGTSIAQLIPIIFSPLLTRLYTPNDFGHYATFLAFSAVLTVLATLRYELAIVISKEDEKALATFSLAVYISVILSLALQIAVFLAFEVFKVASSLNYFVHLLGLSVFFHSIYKALYYKRLREKRFKLLANARIINAVIILVVSVSFAFLIEGAIGLIIAILCSYFIASLFLLINGKTKLFSTNYTELKKVFVEFKSFPIFDLPSAFLVQLSNRLPIIMTTKFFPTEIIGQYSLTQRTLDLPTSFVSTAISDTFKQQANEDYIKHGNCLSVFKETRKLLFFLSIFPYIILQFFAPYLFGLVFGSEWIIAGEYAQILALMFLVRFLVGPLTYTFYIRNKLKYNMFGQIVKLVLIAASIYTGILFNDFKLGLILFSASNILIHIAYYFIALKLAR